MNNELIMNRILNNENKKTLCLSAFVPLCLHNREGKIKFVKFVEKMKFVDNNKISINPLKPFLPMEYEN
jgi:hypothetical protein